MPAKRIVLSPFLTYSPHTQAEMLVKMTTVFLYYVLYALQFQ